jgi:hypothetical protein
LIRLDQAGVEALFRFYRQNGYIQQHPRRSHVRLRVEEDGQWTFRPNNYGDMQIATLEEAILAFEVFRNKKMEAPLAEAEVLPEIYDWGEDDPALEKVKAQALTQAQAREFVADIFKDPKMDHPQTDAHQSKASLRVHGNMDYLAQMWGVKFAEDEDKPRFFDAVRQAYDDQGVAVLQDVEKNLNQNSQGASVLALPHLRQYLANISSDHRQFHALSQFVLGEWGLARRLWFFKGNVTSLKHYSEHVPAVETLLHKFAEFVRTDDRVKELIPEIDWTNLDVQVIMDTTMRRGQGASVKSRYGKDGKLIGLTFRVNAHLDLDAMRTAALHEMVHALLGPRLANSRPKTWGERFIDLIYLLIGINREERLVTRATRQFLDKDLLRKFGYGIEAVIEEARLAGSEAERDESASGFFDALLDRFSDPERVRQDLIRQRAALRSA